jgi:hypothetical protein
LRFDFAARPRGWSYPYERSAKRSSVSTRGETLTAQAVIGRNAKVADAYAMQTANKQDRVIKLRNDAGRSLTTIASLAFGFGGCSALTAMVAHILAPRLKRLDRDTRRVAEKLSGKKLRLRKPTDHCISKQTVAIAERSPSAIAILRSDPYPHRG